MALSDDVKAAVSLWAEADRVVTWDRHKSAPDRGDWWAPCPLHGEDTASFHVTEKGGKGGVFHCFGCGAKGSVIDFVMARDGLGFVEAVKHLSDGEGLARKPDPERARRLESERRARRAAAEAAAGREARRRLDLAWTIWRAASADDPRLAAYLAGRGVRLDPIGGVPPSLRLHADLTAFSPSGEVLHRGPAMVAFIGRRRFFGVHRTWVDGPARARDAAGRKVPKQMLGLTGEIFGQPIMLTPGGGDLMIVGEGIETTLAGLSAWRLRFPAAQVSAECAMTLGALAGPEDHAHRPGRPGRSGKPLPSPRPDFSAARPGWLPPEGTAEAIILADPSTKCPETARLHAERAQAKTARHVRRVRLAVPRGRWDHDDDFADLAKLGEF
ncbi:CHC2 zinc finger domain-containing protein [Tropicimonas sp. IMCC34043]|uniref:CHC2 zinc finger domain-containing protein n=1 Tax=Tropicimonas sp. IMCC34043 TaxID=2248760 RepID=UPI000E2658EA|nr:CHC2 zinc finger domain-containing protein [Tropicimonas sp. IMCC34043]